MHANAKFITLVLAIAATVFALPYGQDLDSRSEAGIGEVVRRSPAEAIPGVVSTRDKVEVEVESVY